MNPMNPMNPSTLHTWYIPTWSGDFRLERATDETCLFSIEKPTDLEKTQIKAFFDVARERDWVDQTLPRVTKRTVVEVEVRATLDVAGPALLEIVHGSDGDLWTGVRSKKGTIELIDTKPGLLQKAMNSAANVGTELVAAATVRAPAVGCPAPEPTNRRASQVLQAFSTQRQYGDFVGKGFMAVTGSHTGERYFLFHRDEAARRGLDHVLVDDKGTTVCVWHPLLPAEEEALAVKFLVEHREKRLPRFSLDARRLPYAVPL